MWFSQENALELSCLMAGLCNQTMVKIQITRLMSLAYYKVVVMKISVNVAPTIKIKTAT
jgi:hypothetical protein